MILTLDTNVIISAVVFGGKPREVLELVLEGRCRLAVSGPILEETAGVLSGRKFGYPAAAVKAVTDQLELLAEMVSPPGRISRIKEDPADNRILECAVTSSSDVILSGDRHLLDLKKYRSIPIFTPEEFLSSFPV